MIFKRTKIPYLECAGYKILIRLRKRRFRCKVCKKMAVAETPLVKKNHQIAQKLVEKVPITAIAESLTISTELKKHYNLYQLLLFNFQNKEAENFFELIENNLKLVHPLFQTVFKTFLKDKEKIVNALQLPYSNAKLEATNNLIKLIKRNAFGFRNFDNFKKRIFIALNIKMERTTIVLSRC